ncbi:MAG TPA: GxxExxY protein [Holophagaceae bacterium]|nr:GxxExxY protein [Holophagaceae bacterium]
MGIGEKGTGVGVLEGPYAELTGKVIGAAIDVQRALGPWLLEAAYEACLTHELELRGHRVQRQVGVDLNYRGLKVANAYRMDLMVDDVLVVELKVVESLDAAHEAQVMSYLRFAGKPVGLLLNFASHPLVKNGIRRFVMDNHLSSASSV